MVRRVVITGAAGGIGRDLVARFASEGYEVIATDVVPRPIEIKSDHYFQIDLNRLVEDEFYASDNFAKIGDVICDQKLDALVNNAAIQILGGIDSLSRENWQTTLNVNLLAPFILIQSLLPFLQNSKGNVVNISSIHARLTKRNFVAYATSKAALSGMTRALAVDLEGRVAVNSIELAAIETEMLKEGFSGKEELYEQLGRCHPSGRIGKAEEVAALVLSICSGEMSFLNGSCLAMDGGISGRLFDPD